MVTESKPTWQPLSLLPVVALMLGKALRNSEDQYEALSEARDKSHVLDDETVSRAIRLYRAQLEDLQLYEEQLRRWQSQPLTSDQRKEVDRLLGQLPRIKHLSETILEMLSEIKDKAGDEFLDESGPEAA
jgi:hypothetical protein